MPTELPTRKIAPETTNAGTLFYLGAVVLMVIISAVTLMRPDGF